MDEIGIFNETLENIEELDTIRQLLEYAIAYENINDIEFNVIVIDNERIRKINLEYRGKDQPTDVISFALEDDHKFVSLEHRVLGDIYISLDKVYEQSKEYGHSFLRELAFLSIHGFLHLLGYDHMEEDDEKIMFARQEEILNGFDIKK